MFLLSLNFQILILVPLSFVSVVDLILQWSTFGPLSYLNHFSSLIKWYDLNQLENKKWCILKLEGQKKLKRLKLNFKKFKRTKNIFYP